MLIEPEERAVFVLEAVKQTAYAILLWHFGYNETVTTGKVPQVGAEFEW